MADDLQNRFFDAKHLLCVLHTVSANKEIPVPDWRHDQTSRAQAQLRGLVREMLAAGLPLEGGRESKAGVTVDQAAWDRVEEEVGKLAQDLEGVKDDTNVKRVLWSAESQVDNLDDDDVPFVAQLGLGPPVHLTAAAMISSRNVVRSPATTLNADESAPLRKPRCSRCEANKNNPECRGWPGKKCLKCVRDKRPCSFSQGEGQKAGQARSPATPKSTASTPSKRARATPQSQIAPVPSPSQRASTPSPRRPATVPRLPPFRPSHLTTPKNGNSSKTDAGTANNLKNTDASTTNTPKTPNRKRAATIQETSQTPTKRTKLDAPPASTPKAAPEVKAKEKKAVSFAAAPVPKSTTVPKSPSTGRVAKLEVAVARHSAELRDHLAKELSSEAFDRVKKPLREFRDKMENSFDRARSP